MQIVRKFEVYGQGLNQTPLLPLPRFGSPELCAPVLEPLPPFMSYSRPGSTLAWAPCAGYLHWLREVPGCDPRGLAAPPLAGNSRLETPSLSRPRTDWY